MLISPIIYLFCFFFGFSLRLNHFDTNFTYSNWNTHSELIHLFNHITELTEWMVHSLTPSQKCFIFGTPKNTINTSSKLRSNDYEWNPIEREQRRNVQHKQRNKIGSRTTKSAQFYIFQCIHKTTKKTTKHACNRSRWKMFKTRNCTITRSEWQSEWAR